jgi:carbon storage regulator CsrA
MLVLTRKLNESIIVNGNIRIMVVGIRGNHVRIGIEAPGSVSIIRKELEGQSAKFARLGPPTCEATDPAHAAESRPS